MRREQDSMELCVHGYEGLMVIQPNVGSWDGARRQ